MGLHLHSFLDLLLHLPTFSSFHPTLVLLFLQPPRHSLLLKCRLCRHTQTNPNANPNCNPLPLFHARCRPNNPFAQRHHFHQRQTDLPSTSSNRLQSSESLSRHNCVLQHVHTPRPFVLIQPAPCGALNSTNGCLTGMNQDLL